MFGHGCLDTCAVLAVSYACVFYFGLCNCSEQLSMIQMERPSRNKIIITAVLHPAKGRFACSQAWRGISETGSENNEVVVACLLNVPATC